MPLQAASGGISDDGGDGGPGLGDAGVQARHGLHQLVVRHIRPEALDDLRRLGDAPGPYGPGGSLELMGGVAALRNVSGLPHELQDLHRLVHEKPGDLALNLLIAHRLARKMREIEDFRPFLESSHGAQPPLPDVSRPRRLNESA